MKNYQGMMRISAQRELIHDVYELIIEGEAASFIKQPGQFINIKLTKGQTPYLRRPMSVCDYDDHSIKMIYKVVGQGTKLLSQMHSGDELDVLTGLGNGFDKRDTKKALVIGGGLGVPPMYNLTKKLLSEGVEVTAVLGFNSAADCFYKEEFEALCPTYIATMKGDLGVKGTVINAIQDKGLAFDHYYACGPLPMLNALAKTYPEHGYLSYEARMGCGFGACMGCSMKVKGASYKRVCVEGPVFTSEEVIVNG